jgi:hypothetical protein|uniref:MobA/MobL n=1 Tax=Halomonas sp. Ant2 TaxID=1630300 RepID=A0A0D5MAV0_9GAMM|nr:MobA/MobL family protein [Halomonas sp. Ant2]AJY53637.1 MobA/MobL [Halomonas sp. Ant2]|tara:strand:- start:1040 stop:2569 length:1530 start_codon:yes stop_codon:yes gene_type:complete
MAIYHLHAKAFRRKDGRSATAAAAYRAGELIVDERTGAEHDYTKKGGVLGATLFLPGGSTESRGDFWNRVEKHHRRGDAVTAREVEISLPHELDNKQRKALAFQFARELSDRYGVAVDVALHAPRSVSDRDLERNPDQFHMTDPETGKRHNGNWHAHLLFSACHVELDGKLGKKAVELDPIHCQRQKIPNMTDKERGRWCDLQNAALEHAATSVDHRSFKDRGSDQEPTVHLGGYAARMRREGTPELSDNAALNAEINSANDKVRKLRKQRSNERAEQQIGQRHQLQIRAEMRALYAAQQRAYDRQETAEWQAWISEPFVCSATGRIYAEDAVDRCMLRESQYPENQPSPGGMTLEEMAKLLEMERRQTMPSSTASKPSPTPSPREEEKPAQSASLADSGPGQATAKPVPQAPQPRPVFDAKARALEIIKMNTNEERAEAFREAMLLDLGDFDAIDIELEPLMFGVTGELTSEGQRLRAEFVSVETTQRVQQVKREQDWEPQGGGSPGM